MITAATPLLPFLERFRSSMDLFRALEADDRWLYGADVCEVWAPYISNVYLFGP